ncbi:MAG: YbaB/EbfC family nucleoid-associated protein [Candidatus Tokpelaia sp.]|nr:MAG: YbaB/EbfC family nucleoid-associated protein [Candidatus Tokpelaia sp.]KAA6207278.1 MAG: YbaB/EbfC family nucleoid-associated protein [Candidatus Tokpelaia sp.]
MRDLMGMMKKAKEMQTKMQDLQAEMANLTAEGKAGGGLVAITLGGDGKVRAVNIDSSLMKEEEKEILEDLLLAAYNEAKEKIETAIAEKTQTITAGLPVPPGFKLPF